MGRGTTMRPAVIDIAAFTWHDTEPGRLAWTETSDNETTLLQTGWVDPAGTFSPGEAIAEVPAGAWLDAWHTWGFLVSGWDPTTETPLVYLLDDDGNELWRFSDVYPYTGFSSSGEILLIRWDTIDPSQRGEPELFVVSPAATARVTLTSLGWDPTGGEGTLGPASLSPDGSRLAFVVWEGELRNGDWDEEGRIEVRLRNGTFVGAFAFSGFARAMEWSGDGRFVLLPVGNTLRVYDTVDDVLHDVEFDAPIDQVFVQP